LHKLIEIEFNNIDPIKDVQTFISKNSSFTENDRLRKLYMEMGMFFPMSDVSNPMGSTDQKGNVLIEKTSRVMAQ
jgi:hypothetical protein